MGVNYSKTELFELLKTERVPVSEVEVGDILVTGHGPEVIDKVVHKGQEIGLCYDRDENGFTAAPDMTVKRLIRSSLRAFET